MRNGLPFTREPFQFVSRALIFFTCAIVAAYSAQFTSASYDTYWHLQTGLDFLSSGASPWVDTYSYTYPLEEITNQPFLFQLILASINTQFPIGLTLQIIKWSGAFVLMVALSLYLTQVRANLAVFSACMIGGLFFYETRPLVRPELIDLTLVVLAFAQYHTLLKSFELRHLLPTVALTGSWIIYHAGILPYVIFCGLFVDVFLKNRIYLSPKSLLLWLLWGFVFLALGFLDSSGRHPLLAALSFSDNWIAIAEHQPTSETIRQLPFAYTMWALMCLAIIWSIATRRIGIALVLTIFLWASVDRVRMISISGIVLICCSALLSQDEASKRIFAQLRRSVQTTLRWATMGFSLIAAIYLTSTIEKLTRYDFGLPDKVMNYWSLEELSGNVLNLYDFGGYLINRGEGSAKVFIDGRTNILYPYEFFALYLAVARGDHSALSAIHTHHNPDYAIWNFDKRFYIATKKLGLSAEYVGNKGILFSRHGKLSPLADRLLFPMCQSFEDRTELENVREILVSQSERNEDLIGLVTALSDESPKETLALLSSLSLQHPKARERALKLLAYSATSQRDFSTALQFWITSFDEFELATLDLLYATDVALKVEEYAWSRTFLTTLFYGYLSGNMRVTASQIVLGERLHEQLVSANQSNDALKQLIDPVTDDLRQQRKNQNLPEDLDDLSTGFVDSEQCENLLNPALLGGINTNDPEV